MQNIKAKVVSTSGASSGMGKTTAIELAKNSAKGCFGCKANRTITTNC